MAAAVPALEVQQSLLRLGDPHLPDRLHGSEPILEAGHHDAVALVLDLELEAYPVRLAAQQFRLRVRELARALALLGRVAAVGRHAQAALAPRHGGLRVLLGDGRNVILARAGLGRFDQAADEDLAVALDARDLFFELVDGLEVLAEVVEARDVRVPAGVLGPVPAHAVHGPAAAGLRAVSLEQGAREGAFEACMTDGLAHRVEDAGGRGGVGEQGRGGGVRVRQEGEEGLGEVLLRVAVR